MSRILRVMFVVEKWIPAGKVRCGKRRQRQDGRHYSPLPKYDVTSLAWPQQWIAWAGRRRHLRLGDRGNSAPQRFFYRVVCALTTYTTSTLTSLSHPSLAQVIIVKNNYKTPVIVTVIVITTIVIGTSNTVNLTGLSNVMILDTRWKIIYRLHISQSADLTKLKLYVLLRATTTFY